MRTAVRLMRFSWDRAAAVALIGGAVLFPAHLMIGKSVTHDEVVMIPAGYSYLRTGEVRLNPMHTPLIKEISAIPLLFLDLELPVAPEVIASAPIDYQREFGRRFLDRPDRQRILFWARLPVVLLSGALAVLVFIWSRELWGRGGGFLALLLYVLDPTITAHAQFVTTDVGIAFFSTLFLFALRAWASKRSATRLVLCGLTLGLALGTKFSAVVLLPVSALLLAISACEPSGAYRRKSMVSAAGAFAVMSAIAFMVVWTIYLFPDDPGFYLKGMRSLGADHVSGHYFFLMGEFRQEGWLHYLLIAWLVKTPLPTLLIVMAALLFGLLAVRTKPLDEAFLAVPMISLFVGYSLLTSPQGVRYLIPCFPLLYVFCGRLWPATSGITSARVTLFGLIGWLVLEFSMIWPDHLAYFNQIAGGPRGGVHWLDDSNVDWGQGLLQLRDYVEKEGLAAPKVCAFWHFDPRLYGIPVVPIDIRELVQLRPEGRVILSSHCVARVQALLKIAHGEASGNWLAHEEPKTIVGHVYYVYDLGAGNDSGE